MTERRLQIAVGLPVLLGALDLTVISAVLPAVVSELRLPVPDGVRQASWLVTAYLIAYAIGILGAGRLSDRVGSTRVLRIALVGFAAASVAVAISGTWSTRLVQQVAYRAFEIRPAAEFVGLWVLVGARALQALAAGALVPSGMSFGWKILRTSRWLGFVAAVDLAGWTLGHLYGGIIIRMTDWRVAFWLNIPFVVLSLWLLRDPESPAEPNALAAPTPWTRWGLAAIGLSLAIFGMGGAEGGATALRPGWLIGGLVVGAAAFIGNPDALLPVRAVLHKPTALVANIALGYVVFLVLAMVPLFVAVLIEPDSVQAGWTSGWMLSVFTVPMALVAWWSGRWRSPASVWVGGIGAVLGFLLVSRWEPALGSMMPALIVLGLSLGVWFGPLAETVLARVPNDESGSGSAIVILARLVGMAVGTATLTNFVLTRIQAVTSVEALRADLLDIFQSAALLGVFGAGLLLVVGLIAVPTDQTTPSL